MKEGRTRICRTSAPAMHVPQISIVHVQSESMLPLQKFAEVVEVVEPVVVELACKLCCSGCPGPSDDVAVASTERTLQQQQ